MFAGLLGKLDKLYELQHGVISPIEVTIAPTLACQLNCKFCSMRRRLADGPPYHMPYEMFVEAMDQFYALGVREVTFSGSGDPLLWPHLWKAVDTLRKHGVSVALVTNGLAADKYAGWYGDIDRGVTLSLNSLEYEERLPISRLWSEGAQVHTQYVWHEASLAAFGRVFDFVYDHDLTCSIVPDCTDGENTTMRLFMEAISCLVMDSAGRFELSNPGESMEHGTECGSGCYMQLLYPCLEVDGNVYACPCSDLACEHDRRFSPEAVVCRFNEIEKFYRSPTAYAPVQMRCSYCKLFQQQQFLRQVLAAGEVDLFG